MDARDILRIALFFVIAIFALHQFSFFKIKNVAQFNKEEQEEEEEKPSQQFHQQSQNTRNIIIQEQLEYENEMSEK